MQEKDGYTIVSYTELKGSLGYIIAELAVHRDIAISRHGTIEAFIVHARNHLSGLAPPADDPKAIIEGRARRHPKQTPPGYTDTERALEQEERWAKEQRERQQGQDQNNGPSSGDTMTARDRQIARAKLEAASIRMRQKDRRLGLQTEPESPANGSLLGLLPEYEGPNDRES